MIRLTAVLALLLAADARADEVILLDAPAPVIAVEATSQGVWARTEVGDFRIAECEAGPVCFARQPLAGALEPAPSEALPDGRIAVAASGDIRRAWYARPTRRYAHAVLGDAIEGGSLVVETADGSRNEFVLPQTHVFEDITPRIADLDGDGANEVVTIRASLTHGAGTAVFGMKDGALGLLAASREIGRSNRWMNIAAVGGPFTLPGAARAPAQSIISVITPHLGGPLVADVFRRGRLRMRRVRLMDGPFSSHVIGSRALALAILEQGSHGTIAFVPLHGRRAALVSGPRGVRRIALPSPVVTDSAVVGDLVVTGLVDGRLAAIPVGPPFR